MDVELTRISEFVQGLDDLVDIGNAVVYGVDQRGNSVKIEVSRLTDKSELETRVTTLETGKSNVGHTHTSSQVSDLHSFVQGEIAGKADKTELTPLQSGITQNTTDIATNSSNIATNTAAINTINNKIGEPSGLAELDQNGKVSQSQLPSFVDDVEEYSSLSNFPATGESGKIYIATDTNITYRWGGSTYVPIGSDLALGETLSTAYRGDRGKTAYDHSQTSGNPHNTSKTDVGLGNVANLDQSKAIKSITRSGTTFTATALDGTTSTFTQQDNNTTYSAATKTAAGLMSAADKIKLDQLPSYCHISYNLIKTGTASFNCGGTFVRRSGIVIGSLWISIIQSKLEANQLIGVIGSSSSKFLTSTPAMLFCVQNGSGSRNGLLEINYGKIYTATTLYNDTTYYGLLTFFTD